MRFRFLVTPEHNEQQVGEGRAKRDIGQSGTLTL